MECTVVQDGASEPGDGEFSFALELWGSYEAAD